MVGHERGVRRARCHEQPLDRDRSDDGAIGISGGERIMRERRLHAGIRDRTHRVDAVDRRMGCRRLARDRVDASWRCERFTRLSDCRRPDGRVRNVSDVPGRVDRLDSAGNDRRQRRHQPEVAHSRRDDSNGNARRPGHSSELRFRRDAREVRTEVRARLDQLVRERSLGDHRRHRCRMARLGGADRLARARDPGRRDWLERNRVAGVCRRHHRLFG